MKMHIYSNILPKFVRSACRPIWQMKMHIYSNILPKFVRSACRPIWQMKMHIYSNILPKFVRSACRPIWQMKMHICSNILPKFVRSAFSFAILAYTIDFGFSELSAKYKLSTFFIHPVYLMSIIGNLII